MKKQIILLSCLFLFFNTFLQAQQEFTPIGAKWQFEQYGCFGNPAYYGFLNIEVTKDTFLLNKNARVLSVAYINDCSENMTNQEIILASEGDKVYHYLNESYYVLYDFSAQVGDTIWHQPTAFQHIDPIHQQFDVTIDRFCSIVDSVSTITIDGQLLRQQHIRACDLGDNFYALRGKVIEKIGFLKGLLGTPSYDFFISRSYPYLKCYEDNAIFYDNDCESVGINEPKPIVQNNIQLLMDRNLLIIEGIKKANTTIFLYDMSGKLQNTYIADISTFSTSTRHLKTGLYIVDIPAYDFSQTIFKF